LKRTIINEEKKRGLHIWRGIVEHERKIDIPYAKQSMVFGGMGLPLNGHRLYFFRVLTGIWWRLRSDLYSVWLSSKMK
jgi:hypothetical protein